MFEWLRTPSGDFWSIVVAIAVSVIGAIVGSFIRWLLDRSRIKKLRKEREDARLEREDALKRLAKREAESEERQRKLDEAERELKRHRKGFDGEKSKLDKLLATLRRSNDVGLWTTFPKVVPFEDYDTRVARRKPVIITVANNKGGVGKTSITGNLIAYFDKHLGKRVLAVDLDYQGSLSTMLRKEQDGVALRKSGANLLLERGAGLGALHQATRGLGRELSRSQLVPAFYELAPLEDRLMVEWLLQESGDVRYRLASILLSKELEHKYDVILLDCAPRLSTGTINALCASTHVLVPTIFNPLSAEPVANFLGTSTALMDRLNPKLEFLGVVETMTPRTNEARATRSEGRRMITEALQTLNRNIQVLDSNIPRLAMFAEAGVAYLTNNKAVPIFNALGDEINGKIGL